jgi:hypothetical protein
MAELSEAIARVGASLATEPLPERADSLKLLRSLHESLMRATRGVAETPGAELRAAADAVAPIAHETVDALAPRQRTVYRLLRTGAVMAAWEVLIDNGTGVVEEGYDASTATGAARTSPRLPLLTRIEAGTVYAELPGFRDPRYAVPDDCYDITPSVRLKCQLEELVTSGTQLTVAGWAAFDVLTAGEREKVVVVVTSGDREIVWPARRVRRADLVSGRGEALTRRAWAGFSAAIDLGAAELSAGEWALWVELDHDGVVVRQPLGRDAAELAAVAARASIRAGPRAIRWETNKKQWALVVSEKVRESGAASDAVGG